MKIYNFLPQYVECMGRWEKAPLIDDFVNCYYKPMAPLLEVMFDDFKERLGHDFYSVLEDLNWSEFRAEAMTLKPDREELRLRKHIDAVEKLFGFELSGEAVLFGSFACMDGYARFDQGTHRVFLGVDESHGRDPYLDILMTHELTHVARESRPEVWEGFGLNPKMSHDELTESMPVIEHLMSEGFSCVVSELLEPGHSPWLYAYQNEEGLAKVLQQGPAVDRVVHNELRNHDGDYGTLYDVSQYSARMPSYAHYVWAWQWAKRLLDDLGGDPRKLVALCSKDLKDHALKFKLRALA